MVSRRRTSNDLLIGGFIIEGDSPLTVVVRARGPSLAAQGVPNTLADTFLQLFRSSDRQQIAVNDNWKATQATELSASGFAPANDLESAILITLTPGAYTALVTGSNGGGGVGIGTGIGIIEVFKR